MLIQQPLQFIGCHQRGDRLSSTWMEHCLYIDQELLLGVCLEMPMQTGCVAFHYG
ncbi:hypothetical protein Gotri_018981 [Gossypium trilobum]|uniref:Uncharacterized protein n=1 Tax=Gossypium trilobum TaxID=34281 RepID=A0A7J9EBB0_9ROSI|nr:hypothetical protein [Gossypium trilobum]